MIFPVGNTASSLKSKKTLKDVMPVTGDEFCKRCNCRKHLRWTQDGNQYRRKVGGTRSWEQAEEEKRRLEDQLAGRTCHLEPTTGKPLTDAITVFIQSKKSKNITKKVLDKYTRELSAAADLLRVQGSLDRPSVDRGVAHRVLRDVAEAIPLDHHAVQGARALPIISPVLLSGTLAGPSAAARQHSGARARDHAAHGCRVRQFAGVRLRGI